MTIGFAVFSIPLIATIVSFLYERTCDEDGAERERLKLEGIKDQLGIDEVMERLERIEKAQ